MLPAWRWRQRFDFPVSGWIAWPYCVVGSIAFGLLYWVHTTDSEPFWFGGRPADPEWQAVADCACDAMGAQAPTVIVAADLRPPILGRYRWWDDLVILADRPRGTSGETLAHEIAHALEARGAERGWRWWTPVTTQRWSHSIDDQHHGGDEFYELLQQAEAAVERCLAAAHGG